jgi:poly(hydroxyalkanoate) depolymerase family esterase
VLTRLTSSPVSALLKRAGAVVHQPAWPAPRPASPGRWLAGSFRNAYGQRNYRLYVPGRYVGQAMPLLVMLHGCTQDPDDFAATTGMNDLADRCSFLVLYPEQSASAHERRCWQWFQPEHQARSQGEPAVIAGLTRRVMREYAVDPDRVYVAGLSAGGAMAVVLGVTYPELFAAVGVHSGLPYKAGEGLLSAWMAMRLGTPAVASMEVPAGSRAVPLIVFHGDADRTVSLANSNQLVAQWAHRYALCDGATAATIAQPMTVRDGVVPAGYAYSQALYGAGDQTLIEQWTVHGLGHAWSGGSPAASHADPLGPDASAEMARFFAQHPMLRRRARNEFVKRNEFVR